MVWRCGGSGGASPARPCLAQCLALEVELPPPPQRPNERHRGCGARGAAGSLGRPSPHPARGAATSFGDPARLRRPARPPPGYCEPLRPAAPAAVLSSGPLCGAAPSGGGSAQTSSSPPPTAGFPTWKKQMQPLLAARAGLWGCRLPGLALGKCRGAGASAALAAPGE